MSTQTTVSVVLLEFADRSQAPTYLDQHNAWIEQGFADGMFVMTGTIPDRGGLVFCKAQDRSELEERVSQDPFVAHGIVTAEIIDVIPSRLHVDLVDLLG